MARPTGNRPLAGFTLIELLVVIAIIAILAAILFPVFAQARESARKISCTSNLKQINLGLLQYVQDYDETFPAVTGQNYTAPPGDSAWDPNQTWIQNDIVYRIQPYVKSFGVFFCPDRGRNVGSNGDFCTGAPQTQPVWGYGYNWSSGYGPGGGENSLWNRGDGCVLHQLPDGTLPGRAIASINQPAQFITLGDTADTPRQTMHTASFDTRCNPSSGWNADMPTGARHQGGNNIGFSDGHVKWYHLNAALVDPYGVGVTTPAVVPNRYWFSATWNGTDHSP